MDTLEPSVQPRSSQPAAEPEWEVAWLFPRRGEWREADYLALPTNRLIELTAGSLEFLPVPTESHQLIAGFLYEALVQFVRSRNLGTVLFMGMPVRVEEGKFREPDVIFMRREHSKRRHEQYWEGADLAIEVVSDGGRHRDLVSKREEYARAGIAEYWIVDPESERIQVLALDGAAYQLAGDYGPGATAASFTVGGFSVSVSEVLEAARGTS